LHQWADTDTKLASVVLLLLISLSSVYTSIGVQDK